MLIQETSIQVFKMGEGAKNSDKITLLIVEDHAMMRELLAKALASQSDFLVVGCAADAETGISLCEKLQPNVVILDSILPGLQGPGAVEGICKVSPRCRILMISGSVSPVSIHQALEGGARGFISKHANVSELIEGIRAINGGRYFFGAEHQDLVRGLFAQVDKRNPGSLLSSRESSILACLAQGKSSKEIAAQIGLSVFTVENHRRRVMQKTGVRSTAQLTLLAVELGLVSPAKLLNVPSRPSADRKDRQTE